jgi:hypothetical protein
MFRTFTVLVLAIVYSHLSVAQIFKGSLNWHEPLNEQKAHEEKKPYLFFENAFYPNSDNMLPVFYEIRSLSGKAEHYLQDSYSFETLEYAPLNSDEIKFILNQGDVANQSKPEVLFYNSGGQGYAQITIPAIRQNPSTLMLEKLVRYTVSISGNEKSTSSIVLNKTKSNSVLSNGTWNKIKVTKSGIYKITYAELEAMGLANIQNVTVWGHGGGQLPYWNNQSSKDDLMQLPIWIETGSDGVFNQGDYILFYAEGPVTWNYNSSNRFFQHKIHEYSTAIHYFITTSVSNPLRISYQAAITLPVTKTSSSYDALNYFERNDTNLIKSGRQWFGESFDVYTSRNFTQSVTNPIIGDTTRLLFQTTARSGASSKYGVKVNGSSLGTIDHAGVNLSSDYSNYVSFATKSFSYIQTSNVIDIELTYNKPSAVSKAWLDYITLNSREKTQVSNSQLSFRDRRTRASGAITQFEVESSLSGLMVWDITNIFSPEAMPLSQGSNGVNFKTQTNDIREFVAFTHNQAYAVTNAGAVANQNIHGAQAPEMVIVTHPNFLSQAQALADIHLNSSNLKSLVVTTEQVYNEFSGGNADVSAIRNMMRMFYKRATSEADMPKYLLLFGDGSYDNLTQSASNTNYIPTYQSLNSIEKGKSFVSDDFFGLLDDNEGEATGLLDIGIGRIPCSSVNEADVAVNKVQTYLSSSSHGSWHNTISFIADDQDSNVHMQQANDLATYVRNNYPLYNIEKIYFDAYPQISTAQGHRFPDATDAINNRANLGALIMNYTGHANPRWLALEKVLMITDIQSWRNLNNLPLVVTATCEYSRFDDFSYKSAGEHILFSPKGGGIGLVSTTRVVYSYPNYTLNQNFFQIVFKRDLLNTNGPTDGYNRIGDVIRKTKNLTGGDNKLSFMLLGDPALKLHYPSGDLAISNLNGVTIAEPLDTLKALSRVKIEGISLANKTVEAANFEAEITLYDKEKQVTTLANDGGNPYTFTTRQNVVYKGRASVTNNQFRAEFIVPKDIQYNFGQGRFSLFATNGAETYGGYFENFTIGGISENINTDNVGPEIEIYMNDKKFVSGGITDPNPKLLVVLTDSSGINTTGTGIGHDLSATLSGSTTKTYSLNEYYRSDLDNFQKGGLEFQLLNLNKEKHSVKVKAWDVFNNSSEKEIEFEVRSDEALELTKVLNYPNPFTDKTAFYFEHNQPYENFDVSFQIFSPSGKLVKTINYTHTGANGYRVGPIPWDGFDDYGNRIGRGVYFYKLKVKLANGKYAEVYQKLVILK